MLPLACLSNSRYMTHDLLKDMMDDLGFDLEVSHNSEKLSFKMFTKKRTTSGKRWVKEEKSIFGAFKYRSLDIRDGK